MAATVSLARRPTPLQRLPRLSAALGVEVHVKRDDLTGLGLSGNKVRKLEYLLADAQARGADTLITTGGLQSNHCRATSVAARRLGMDPVLLLRGELPSTADSNLLLDQLLGATLHTCDEQTYRERRDEVMAELADELRGRGRRPYVIPEGGSNGLGALGYIEAAREVSEQTRPFDAVFVAVGSGGTLAGLALGAHIGPLRGVAVCDDGPTFRAAVERIAGELPDYRLPPPGPDTWDVLEGYQGEGYGLASTELWAQLGWVARLEGLLLDPVYTGKAMEALVDQTQRGLVHGRVLFWHTGGAFGLFGRGHEWAAAD